MNRIERQARWNGALVHWFHGPPVALLSYPPHWFHRIGHAGCKTLFYSRRVMGSRWTVLFLRQRSTQETLLCEASSSKRIISIVEKKKKDKLSVWISFSWLLYYYRIFGKRKWIHEISKIHFEERIQNSSRVMAQQRPTLPDIRWPFVEMHSFFQNARENENQGRDACTSLFGRFSNKAVSIFLSFLSRRMPWDIHDLFFPPLEYRVYCS